MTEIDIGNKINQRIVLAKQALFLQGEMAQLTFLALENAAKAVQEDEREVFEISYPVGYLANKQAISDTRKYKKQELIEQYSSLGSHQLAINGIYQLVTILDALFGDIIRYVVLKFPNKLGSKRSIKTSIVISASSIEEVQLQAIDSMLNELSYKSPREFAEECQRFLSINLLECPAYHKYIEIKATRDIYIHNQGNANNIYVAKSQSHARVKSGQFLPVGTVYFLESYESCIQITEWLESSLHDVWHSSEYEEYLATRKENVQPENPADA